MWFDDSNRKSSRGNRRGAAGRRALLEVQAARLGGGSAEQRYRLGGLALLAVSLAGVLWFGIAGTRLLGQKLFAENGQFAIRRLVLSSNGKLTPELIRDYAHLAEGQNLFALDIAQVRRDLESVPVVSRVELRRELPDTLRVSVTERVALARLGDDERLSHLALDRDGFVLGPTSVTPQLPAITGLRDRGLRPGSQVVDPLLASALQLIDLADQARFSAYLKIKSIDIGAEDYLDVRLGGGERLLISREALELKLGKFTDILKRSAGAGRQIAAVDMTVERNFPVQYR